jgi:ribosome-binding factor A
MTRHGRSDKAASFRRLRVGEELRHALAEVLSQGNLRHPALDKVSITVSEVRVSPDLRNATAFVMPLGGGRLEEVLEALEHSAPYLRAQMARRVKLRYMPALGFEADRSFDHASRVDRLLREVGGDPEAGAEPDHATEDGGDGS